MKHTIKIAAAALLATVVSVPSAVSQNALRSGYFLEGYYNRHELNPAFAPENNFVTIPALGGFYEGLTSNVGVSTFLYPVTVNGEDKLATFMSPDVSAKEFLGKLKGTNHINESFKLPIAVVGFRGLGGYNTISISVNADANVALPKDLFTFMKLGMTSDDTRYNFSGLGVDASAMATIALGHSHQVLPQLRIGAKAKVLLGVGNAHARIDNFQARLSNDVWKISARGVLDVAAGSGLRFHDKGIMEDPSNPTLVDWSDIGYDSFGLSGFGLAFDLGGVYQLTPDLELSASLLDLGFMSWSNVHTAATKTTEWEFSGFKDIALDSNAPDYEENKLGEQLDKIGDDLKDCFDFHMKDTDGSRTSGIGATFMLGAQYTMPFYRCLRGGFLLTQRINGAYSWTEGRISANVSPISFFDASVNVGLSSFGSSLGAMLNFHPMGVNFFAGVDYVAFKYTPQGVPVGRANLQMSFGFNFNFGGKKHQSLEPLLASNFSKI